MKANKQKLMLAMARACMDTDALTASAGMPRPTVNNVICGRSVRPGTLGKIARALGVDPAEIIETKEDPDL